MKKYLSWKETLMNETGIIGCVFLGGGGYTLYNVVNWAYDFSFGLLALAIGLMAVGICFLWGRKNDPVIICPECKQELLDCEIKAKFSLCCKQEIKID